MRSITMVIGPDVRELIDAGYLAPFRYLAPSTDIDLSRVRSIGGDYNSGDLEQAVDQDGITGDVVEHYLKHLARTNRDRVLRHGRARRARRACGSATQASRQHRSTAPCRRISGATW